MATPVGRIEKEFLLKVIYEEKLPVKLIRNRAEYILTLEQPAEEDELVFRSDIPLSKVKLFSKFPLKFNYHGQIIDFTVEVQAQERGLLFCKTAGNLHKNLDRNYLRVDTPSDLKIIFSFQDDRYALAFPRLNEYENIMAEDFIRNLDPKDLSALVQQITDSLGNMADGYKIVNFKDKVPESIEEKIVSATGKILFLPSTAGFIPKTDPYPKKRIITEEIFKSYLKSTGMESHSLDEYCAKFLTTKFDNNIFSEAWIPILFHEYVIGYILIWSEQQGKLPFDYGVLDSVYQSSKVLAFSLKENGYFEHGKVDNVPFAGRVLDMSASGLLFACPPDSGLLSTLLIDADLSVNIQSPSRSMNIVSRIVRKFNDGNAVYFGCRFLNVQSEDLRFLFEYLYGRQLDAADSEFLSGQV
ncbi:MAG: PilZ domain-containing protein [Treponema sp.]|jgi:hypothetical protein|nr:PilZ domain-containing protein [Treponema sp.]